MKVSRYPELCYINTQASPVLSSSSHPHKPNFDNNHILSVPPCFSTPSFSLQLPLAHLPTQQQQPTPNVEAKASLATRPVFPATLARLATHTTLNAFLDPTLLVPFPAPRPRSLQFRLQRLLVAVVAEEAVVLPTKPPSLNTAAVILSAVETATLIPQLVVSTPT
jgi:hypothetical protein